MLTIERVRDAVGFGLSWLSIYAVCAQDNAVMSKLPYIFFPYFLFDLPFVKGAFLVHHLLGLATCVSCTYTPYLYPMLTATVALEFSTPIWFAVYYAPRSCKLPLRLLFFVVFFVFRIHHYGKELVAFEPFDHPYPYPNATFATLIATYALNLYWFAGMVSKLAAFAVAEPRKET
jgi:hypothetical protein